MFALSPLVSTIFYDNMPEIADIVTDEATTGTGGYLRAALLLMLGTIGLFNYFRNFKKLKGNIPTQLFLLGIFILISFGSSFYSIDQKFTLIRATLLFSVFGFLLGFYTWLRVEGSLNKALNTLFILGTILVFVSLLSLIFIPSRVWWWKATRMIGFFEHPNNFGAFCMLLYPIFIWKFYNIKTSKRFWVILIILLNIFLHILSGSRTTIISASIGFIIWLIFEKSWIKLFFTSTFMIVSFIILINVMPSSFSRKEKSQLTDLSSREDIWKSAFIFIKEKPFLGYGYGVEGKVFQNEQKLDLEGSFIEKNVRQSLHNGYLSIITGVGIIGFIVWLISVLFPLWLGFTAPFSTIKAYSIITIIMLLITNFI